MLNEFEVTTYDQSGFFEVADEVAFFLRTVAPRQRNKHLALLRKIEQDQILERGRFFVVRDKEDIQAILTLNRDPKALEAVLAHGVFSPSGAHYFSRSAFGIIGGFFLAKGLLTKRKNWSRLAHAGSQILHEILADSSLGVKEVLCEISHDNDAVQAFLYQTAKRASLCLRDIETVEEKETLLVDGVPEEVPDIVTYYHLTPLG